MQNYQNVKLLIEKFEGMGEQKFQINDIQSDWNEQTPTGRVAETVAKFEHNGFRERLYPLSKTQPTKEQLNLQVISQVAQQHLEIEAQQDSEESQLNAYMTKMENSDDVREIEAQQEQEQIQLNTNMTQLENSDDKNEIETIEEFIVANSNRLITSESSSSTLLIDLNSNVKVVQSIKGIINSELNLMFVTPSISCNW